MPPDPHSNSPELFIDHQQYNWNKPTITGTQLRQLGGLPDDVAIFQKVPGKPDREIKNDTVVDLTKHGPERFSTQAVGSNAG